MENLKKCNLCPRKCNVDRSKSFGFCGAGDVVKVALVSLHKWEEPCLTGDSGAGTIFFSHCNLRCCFCQNYQISQLNNGLDISTERLAEIFIEQQNRHASNIELVTPTHYIPQIVQALRLAKSHGLHLPVVYNSNAYELPESLELLKDYVDIFLPDLKYFDDSIAIKYSAAPDYFLYASNAIKKMFQLVGKFEFDNKGLMKKGVIVRHLILPNHRLDSLKILDWLYNNFGDDIYISLMNQFTPVFNAHLHKKINRRLTTFEYNSVVNHAVDIGVKNCYIQLGKTASENFIPVFDGSGVNSY